VASKKKNVTSAQLGLGALTLTTSPGPASGKVSEALPEGPAVNVRAPEPSWVPGLPPNVDNESPTPSTSLAAADLDLESFDDYDDAAHVDGVPRLHLVDPPRDAPSVIVEAVGDVYEVSRLRNNGTTVACVMWTRKELEELQHRIVAALEMSE
jgi:hypothetical protein